MLYRLTGDPRVMWANGTIPQPNQVLQQITHGPFNVGNCHTLPMVYTGHYILYVFRNGRELIGNLYWCHQLM